MHRTQLLQLVANQIKDAIVTFSDNPLQYFYEEDIRSLLHHSLVKISGYTLLLPSNDWTRFFNQQIKVNPFKAEYPQEDGKLRDYSSKFGVARFDIAYLENIPGFDNHFRLPVSIAIEIKLRINNFNKSTLLGDFDKLQLYKPITNFVGIALLFDQTPNLNVNDMCKYIFNYEKIYEFSELSIDKIEFEDNHVYGLHILLVENKPRVIFIKSPISVNNDIFNE